MKDFLKSKKKPETLVSGRFFWRTASELLAAPAGCGHDRRRDTHGQRPV